MKKRNKTLRLGIALTMAGLALTPFTSAHASCSSEPYVGSICMTAAPFCPSPEYAEANGATLTINQNAALYSLIGTTYGGNGSTTFQLPDLRGRSPVGDGTGVNLPPVALGQKSGQNSVTLTTAQLPSHTHGLFAANQPGTEEVSTNAWLANPAGEVRGQPIPLTGYAENAAPNTMTELSPQSIGATGNNLPIPTVPPQLGVRMCIAVQGLYPHRP
ncbi:tail fiber protein [Halomonas sp. McH1-25]|uniref:phage tail protein n=1 Tax=unclassified Halomonas TaxID=2609666 RepID=UPI001EF5D286|nr:MULTISPECIES: tail fiber protein [unclassified Halomonas]MCG7600465.1 tail fiber protein [Halomonas sp. McH1-25]MCP1342936.1 tail fiber protein [Halomonas sp. FL8]MCP1359972.1 tail fiber protein [Halomonas sp. BBD45]MCP1364910.1 tail fiber protein [Halomonas sp. BBD48]